MAEAMVAMATGIGHLEVEWGDSTVEDMGASILHLSDKPRYT